MIANPLRLPESPHITCSCGFFRVVERKIQCNTSPFLLLGTKLSFLPHPYLVASDPNV